MSDEFYQTAGMASAVLLGCGGAILIMFVLNSLWGWLCQILAGVNALAGIRAEFGEIKKRQGESRSKLDDEVHKLHRSFSSERDYLRKTLNEFIEESKKDIVK